MSKNSNLHKAKKEKNDEFYTLLSDIEKEMVWYKDFFKDKVVYCNCDDARESNFFKYFSENFELLGLKKLITTGYIPGGHGVVLEYSGDKNGDFKVSDDEILTQSLSCDGDFRSPECIEFLKQADVVVTNPPFSLFREYIAQLMGYGKKFIVIGNLNAVTYKEIFPLLKDNKLWFGSTCFNGGAAFFYGDKSLYDPSKMYDPKNAFLKDDKFYWRVNGVRWFTNVPHQKRNTPINLFKKYNSTDFPTYNNYNAIEVSRVENIPEDYDGVMGVPVSFFDKYCPDQFEIIGLLGNFKQELCDASGGSLMCGSDVSKYKLAGTQNGPVVIVDGTPTPTYKRILIKRK